MTIVNFKAYADPRAVPTLVLVDLQQEYISTPRALALNGASAALDNCSVALRHARELGFPVAHMRWIDQAPFFNSHSRFSRWIEGFEPNGADMIFERNRPSCYTSKDFAEIIGRGGAPFVLAGFAGETACLATAIEAFHRGHTFTYLHDASASHALEHADAEEVHRTVSEIIRLYGKTMDTNSWMNSTRQSNVRVFSD